MSGRLDVLRSPDEMRKIALEWDAALSERGVSECSLSSTWIIQWLEAFDDAGAARILCARGAAGRIVGQAAFLGSGSRRMPVLRSLTNTYATRTTIAAHHEGRAMIRDIRPGAA